MPKIALNIVLALSVCTLAGQASAKDSMRVVCSAIAEFKDNGSPTRIGISIDFFDIRAPGGDGRNYTLSSVYQGKLFQGTILDKAGGLAQGKVAMLHGRSELYSGDFKLTAKGDDYVMMLDGKINDDPAGGKGNHPLKARLPCVNISP